MSWRLAGSLDQLRDEVNARWPGRSKLSDGTKGDANHTSASDHTPNARGVVRALDITTNGIDDNWYSEHIRQLGADGFPPLQGGGYVIHDGRIASEKRVWYKPWVRWPWRKYTGSNRHNLHVHVSASTYQSQYDDRRSWGVARGVIPPHKPVPSPTPPAPKLKWKPMVLLRDKGGSHSVWITDGQTKRHIKTPKEQGGWELLLASAGQDNKVHAVDNDFLKTIPTVDEST